LPACAPVTLPTFLVLGFAVLLNAGCLRLPLFLFCFIWFCTAGPAAGHTGTWLPAFGCSPRAGVDAAGPTLPRGSYGFPGGCSPQCQHACLRYLLERKGTTGSVWRWCYYRTFLPQLRGVNGSVHRCARPSAAYLRFGWRACATRTKRLYYFCRYLPSATAAVLPCVLRVGGYRAWIRDAYACTVLPPRGAFILHSGAASLVCHCTLLVTAALGSTPVAYRASAGAHRAPV